ncbi:probable E3 ubiquitin-protein ligase HERC4 isoform X2 [Cimex lectularius]|uniref:HECT domain-containing protein n=1 Tax=Cimex lectularius TaxID=79782 RepID=A0A8I6RUQ2_CIMLE|nr:probable E3 ubiquitin-protein ligase HERC4 isoform X2 [Cimex lectularius]
MSCRQMNGEDAWQDESLAEDGFATITITVMFGWGNTANGELGLGGIEEQYVLSPRELPFPHAQTVKSISCGKAHTLVVTQNGELYSCGSNDFGQLGHDKTRTKLQLVLGLEAFKIKDAQCGENHSLALNYWGEIYAWGDGTHGQLGQAIKNLPKPKIIRSIATNFVVQIASGYNHCMALTNKGELYSWGSNENGQLGLGLKVKSVKEPTLVSSLNGLPIALIACGANHSFAISKSGAVYGWGKNTFGQLGLNSDVDHIYPCQLKTLRSIKVKYISCGEDFSVFLTQDGGVLTCGAGQYGQLGHGSSSNEILPRKVLELMGSTVTQVTCGRRHTLAYIPSRGKVYAFGLGGAGQLGTKQLINSNSPQVVQGPWLMPVAKFRVNKLFAGGDHCLVIVQPNDSKTKPSDYRELPPDTQIWSITPEKVAECQKVGKKAQVDQELIQYLETVAGSSYCLNGSFLMQKDQHFCCTSKHHGVDMALVKSIYSGISRIQNPSIKDIFVEQVSQMLSSLPESPPDAETLRVYLALPYYHEFDNARHSSKLQGPYARAYLRLRSEAARIVEAWYLMQPEDYFDRLIQIYKNVVLLLLRSSEPINMHNFDLLQYDPAMVQSLDILDRLSRVNEKTNGGPKVNYQAFHLSELTDSVDIRVDYLMWAMEKSGKRFFCHYPFLFDAPAKMLLLQTDQSMQMHMAVTEATHRAVAMLLLSPSPVQVQPLLELSVSRENLIQDTIRELGNYSEKDFKKPLKVTFIGEDAEDAGGVKKEFFLLLLREVLDPKYGMFVSDPETNAIWFSEDTFEDEIMYYLVGLICGLAIYNFTIIYMPFPLALYKKLLHEPVGIEDLKEYSPSLAKGLKSLLEYEGTDIEEVFCLKFEITRDVFGQLKSSVLKPNGGNISVTQENKKEYVELYIDYILNKSVERHFRAFHDAFHKVCGGRVLQLFHAQELMAVVIGNEDYDWHVLENTTEYKNGYSNSDPTIRMFWDVFHAMPLSEKKKFLMFLTGTDRIPILGMKAIKIKIQPTSDDKFLPVAHTCFNLLDLPRYKTKEKLKYKLLQAIQQTQGFSLV